jgi:hypothetical protein
MTIELPQPIRIPEISSMKVTSLRWPRNATTAMMLVAISACASSGPTIITNSAPDFFVGNYQTFSFLDPLSTDRGTVRSLNSTHLINATTSELELAGLRRVENNGDLLINFVLSTRETLQTRSTPSAGIHHGRGRYGTWSGYSMSTSTTEVVQRTEGTLAVDVIDRSRNQLVWEGAARSRVTDSMRQNAEQVLQDAIRDIFAQFP